MGIFSKSVSYEEIFQVAKDKVNKVAYYRESITRVELMQYLYNYYGSKRGSVDFHTVMDIVEQMFVSGDIKA